MLHLMLSFKKAFQKEVDDKLLSLILAAMQSPPFSQSDLQLLIPFLFSVLRPNSDGKARFSCAFFSGFDVTGIAIL